MCRFTLLLLILVNASAVLADDFCQATGISVYNVTTPSDGGIRLDVPKRFLARFEEWRTELISTDFGRRQWERFAENKNFVLKIEVTGRRDMGAGTGSFEWNDDGELVGATITLGSELERGYPNSLYYPVLESLSAIDQTTAHRGRLLAITKLSHELGHVDQIILENGDLLRLQDKLMPQYSNIFLKNGWNTKDKKLVEMAEKMGGTPTEIWEHREYKSETIALQFLSEKIKGESFRCDVMRRIKRNVVGNARQYKTLFESLPMLTDAGCFSNS